MNNTNKVKTMTLFDGTILYAYNLFYDGNLMGCGPVHKTTGEIETYVAELQEQSNGKITYKLA